MGLQLVNVPPQLLELPVLHLCDIPYQYMDSDLILRKLRCDLTANKSLWQVGYFQATIDSVVIGECDE
jgi:hypothetical protein